MKGLLEYTLKYKGFPIKDAKDKLSKVLEIPDVEFDKWYLQQRDKIVQFHVTHNKFYRSKIKSLDATNEFEKLPIITKKDFQDGLEDIVSDGFKLKNLYKGSTSGSSGHPFYFVKDKVAHAHTHALIIERYKSHGLNVDSKQARFFGIPLQGASRYKELLKDKLLNRVRFSVFDMSDSILNKYIDSFKKIKFEYVYGYTSSIVLFAKFLLSQNLLLKRICPSLRYCVVTSEVCTPEDRLLIEKAFGVKVLNEYGASEIDVLAFTDIEGDWELSVQNVYFEVVDEYNRVLPLGSEGRILVTSLFNKAMPIIRYEIGDIGVIKRKRGKYVLEKLSGRVNDMVILPSGKKAAGLTFYYVAKSILEKTDSIKEFIIRQISIDEFVFDMVSDREITQYEYDLMKSKMDLYLEPNLKLTVNRVDRIDRPGSGKIKHFYSMLNN